MAKRTKIEKYASGKWDVRTTGDYPRRIGHIAGGGGHFCAEMGPETVGYFGTLKGAADAIEKKANPKPCGHCGERDATPGRHGRRRGQCFPY